MSYCRWSSDKCQSDVYVYEDVSGGYTIHVAGVHPVSVNHVPDFNPLKWMDEGTFTVKYEQYNEAIKAIQYVDLELPYDDTTVNCETLQELKETLETLSGLGYYVPEDAMEQIQEEIDYEEKHHESLYRKSHGL